MAQSNLPKILLVDDKPANLLSMGQVLSGLEAELFKATSGNDALYCTTQHDFAVVLLDIQMPDIDGFEVASLMRQRAATQTVPIIFVTALDRSEERLFKGYDTGAVDYLLKPINPDILRSKVTVFLQLYRQRQALAMEIAVRKQAEEGLRAHEEELQRYTAELERSNKELDAFAYVASHDLKAPLRAIDNLATWIAEDAGEVLSEDARNHLQLLKQRVERMQRLLDGLLQYSRVGRLNHAPEVVETDRMLQDIVALYDLPPGFVVKVAPHMPTFHTPKAPLEQVLRNLIGNAIKHHDRADGRIAVSGQDAGAYVEFTVTDDGPGIPREFHDKIFQMFQTLKPRDEVEGSGMGLALAKKTVESHGGTIGVESVKDRGACFRFTWNKDATPGR